ncbi:uncharacterized protein BDV17DRAFT_289604 [Aspergillus undulatus]|uniref:uncharacterized protein n=1 Tax=Aspergillus undulatus TaxID=1810928 RepID=UPI003CCD0957
MPDPADLPTEQFDQILTATLQVQSYTFHHGDYAFHDKADIQQLIHLLPLNRRWCDALIPRLYSKWIYNGARHIYVSLWEFVRTDLSNSQLAATVRTLNIGNWGSYPHILEYDKPRTII